MNFREGISVKSATTSPWRRYRKPLQPPQSLYQNEEDNPRINFCNYIEVWFKVYWPESGSKVSKSKLHELSFEILDSEIFEPDFGQYTLNQTSM